MMKPKHTDQISYSGMMHPHNFKQWYNFLRCRLLKEWSTEDVSFLLGKPDYYYADFEKMHQVADFLRKESVHLTTRYANIEPICMAFHEDNHGYSEERIVRMIIEQGALSKTYQLIIPWEFKLGKDTPCKPQLTFQEWNEEMDLLSASDTLLHVRLELDKLLSNGYFLSGPSANDLYISVKKTETHKMTIKPRHVKQALYLLIQQGKIIIRKHKDRFTFYIYQ